MITAVTAATASGIVSASAGVVVTLALILLLVFRELAMVIGPRSRSLARVLIISVAPFSVVFAIAVVRQLAALV
jgi:hypothetical protein